MESVKKYKVQPIMTVEQSDLLAGIHLKAEHCGTLFTTSVDVYDKETGKCLAKFRKGVIPPDIQLSAYNALLPAATITDNRGIAGGLHSEGSTKRNLVKDGKYGGRMVRKSDGKISKQRRANEVFSGLAGYYERSVRFPYCRLTAFNRHHLEKFEKAMPIINLVNEYYSKLMPYEYGLQKEMAENTSSDFVIGDTAFTTLTVNKNWQTAVHKDQGDYRFGFGNLLALRKGTFSGGWLCLPRWGIGFDLQNGDLLLMDVHQWHGNTPIVLEDKNAVRLSLVMYYREKMIKCGTMEQELERAKRRRKGDKL